MSNAATSFGRPAAAGTPDHGLLLGLGDDDHSQYLLLAGRAGGQSAFGGTAAGEELALRGTTNANLGQIRAQSPIDFDDVTPANALNPYSIRDASSASFTAAFIGGTFSDQRTADFSNALFIYETLRGSPDITSLTSPGFAAFTLFQGLPVLRAGPGATDNVLNPLVLNAGPSMRNETGGARTVSGPAAVNWAPNLYTRTAGSTLTATTVTGMVVSPRFNTGAGTTVDFGTIYGLNFFQPAVALFGSSAGVEQMTAYYGINFPDMTFGGASAVYSVIRSQLNSGTNKRFLDHTGTAESRLGGPLELPNDFPNGVFRMGASTDFSMGYLGGTNQLYMQIDNPSTTQWRFSAPSTNRLLVQTSTPATGEFNFNCQKFSLGLQTGANGNQVGAFVAGARSTSVAGEWSDFLLTQAANLTVDDAMSLVAGWTVNAPSMTIGTGSVTTAGALNVGGNVNQGSVNRFGVRILSNPSGGSGVNAGLWVTAGRSRFDGVVDINAPIALGGGAAATLGTIGGSGPATAAQNEWVQIEVNGNTRWIPVWA